MAPSAAHPGHGHKQCSQHYVANAKMEMKINYECNFGVFIQRLIDQNHT